MSKLVVPETSCKSKAIRDIATLMENEFFREFFNKYLSNWPDVETSIMFMKMYEALENAIYLPDNEISIEEKKRILALLSEKAIQDLEFRKTICQNMQTFIKGRSDVKFLELKTLETSDENS